MNPICLLCYPGIDKKIDMYNYSLHGKMMSVLRENSEAGEKENDFLSRFSANLSMIHYLFDQLYGQRRGGKEVFAKLLTCLAEGYRSRPDTLKKRDQEKYGENAWFLSNTLCGMSLYVDRFAGDLAGLAQKLPYFEKLGVNLLHLMPLFQSPSDASDGGYAVSDFRAIDRRYGSIEDLKALRTQMDAGDMYLMLDIVLNHTSDQHEWAKKAKSGDQFYQDYYYFFPDRSLPDLFDDTMPEIFPESSPGNFSFIPDCQQWAMTVFHHYQWDLNYSNPLVFVSMLENILFYANLGVDILRIDAPAFIWKKLGTTCQNLPEAHTILRLIKLCVEIVAPGMAILGEAIVAPAEIMKYFGTGEFQGHECDFAYNATQMAVQWDALATSKTRLLQSAQRLLLEKPAGSSWINYTRSHDDIGFGFGDDLIYEAGFDPFGHRKFLKDFYSGSYLKSYARGALFSNNPKTQDARISGTLASLCGLEDALEKGIGPEINLSIARILLMQAMSFSIGGIPMLFSGDEYGATNNYLYVKDPAKSYDNRWMHRPPADWQFMDGPDKPENPMSLIFQATKTLIRLRRTLPMLADLKNIEWLEIENEHVAGFIRKSKEGSLYCLFSFSEKETSISWWVINRRLQAGTKLENCWTRETCIVGPDEDKLFFKAYQFFYFLVGPGVNT
jgi:amylosucrase